MKKELERITISDIIDLYKNQRLNIDHVRNMRELGGYPAENGKMVAFGKLIRSGNLSRLTEEGAEALYRRGITHVVDFRTENGMASSPDVNIGRFAFLNLELASRDVPQQDKKVFAKTKTAYVEEETERYVEALLATDMENMYLDMFKDPASVENMRRFFDLLLSDACRGVIFHCNSGKDRTGVAAGLLLAALGVEPETIVRDYRASLLPWYYAMENVEHALVGKGYSDEIRRKARSFLGVETDTLEKSFLWIGDNYGSVRHYLTEVILLDAEKVQKLKEKYLTEKERNNDESRKISDIYRA